jgi:hypothetical protein
LLDGLQLIPAGRLVTVPVPLPASVTLNVKGINAKAAVTLCAALIMTTQVPVPLQFAPDQPVKVEMAFGTALSVTCVLRV